MAAAREARIPVAGHGRARRARGGAARPRRPPRARHGAARRAQVPATSASRCRWPARKCQCSVDELRFYARGGGRPACPGGGRVRRRATSVVRREPNRDHRPGSHAVELPADDGDMEDRPGARGGQRSHAEAIRELTPLTTLRLGELAAEALPPGVLNVITVRRRHLYRMELIRRRSRAARTSLP